MVGRIIERCGTIDERRGYDLLIFGQPAGKILTLMLNYHWLAVQLAVQPTPRYISCTSQHELSLGCDGTNDVPEVGPNGLCSNCQFINIGK